MSICLPALSTQPIPSCIGFIEIGDVTPNTSVAVYLKDITIDRLMMFQETSNGTGRVIFDTTGNDFSDKHSYELWVTEAAQPITDYMDILVAGNPTPQQVIAVKFFPVYENGAIFSEQIITLQAE